MVRSGDRSLISNELGNLPARLPPQRKGGGTKTYLAKTTAPPTGGVYPIDIYGNGFGSDPTLTDQECQILNLNPEDGETLDIGTRLLVTRTTQTYTAVQ